MKSNLLSAVALAGLLASGQAFAAADTSTTCSSISAGGVTINECVDPDTYTGWYEVTNLSGQSISAFAVSTQNTNTIVSVKRDGWSGFYLTESQWNGGFSNSFDKTFGPADTGAYLYGNKSGSNLILNGATNQGYFGFEGKAFSNFVAFSQSGSVIAQSYTAAVPEPETYAMLLAGLGVLGFMGKRRRAS